jgi:hypothetical protein
VKEEGEVGVKKNRERASSKREQQNEASINPRIYARTLDNSNVSAHFPFFFPFLEYEKLFQHARMQTQAKHKKRISTSAPQNTLFIPPTTASLLLFECSHHAKQKYFSIYLSN